jgi:hypothetical protein
MALSEEEILREAARIRAGRRLRVAKNCMHCGTSFVGIAQAKYCSDACRMAAARERRQDKSAEVPEDQIVRVPAWRPGESIREYWERTANRPLTEEDEHIVAVLERIHGKRMENVPSDSEDSTELIRRMRDERSEYLSTL